MRYKNNLFEKLDWILNETLKYSFTLGDLGKNLLIVVDLRHSKYGRYNARGFFVKPSETEIFESLSSNNLYFKCIYSSEYDYIKGSYKIKFNSDIKKLGENIEKLKDTIRNIENQAIDICNTVVNSYLDPLNECKRILIHFNRYISDYNKIIEEIKESSIFGQSISNNYEFTDPHNKIIEKIEKSTIRGKLINIFRRHILKNDKRRDQLFYMFRASKYIKDINGNIIDLSYPNYYRFSFMIYVKEKDIYKW
jgi:hypothetical protein